MKLKFKDNIFSWNQCLITYYIAYVTMNTFYIVCNTFYILGELYLHVMLIERIYLTYKEL